MRIVPDIRGVSVLSLDFRGHDFSGPGIRIIRHPLPVFVATVAVVIVTGATGDEVRKPCNLRRPVAVFQVGRAMAVFASLNVSRRRISLGTGCREAGSADVGIETHVLAVDNVRGTNVFVTDVDEERSIGAGIVADTGCRSGKRSGGSSKR